MSDRVLVVMDDTFELAMMGAALKLYGTNIIGEAHKESSAILLTRSMQPNVLLIDMHCSNEYSVTIANVIRKQSPTIGVVMLVACADLRMHGVKAREIPLGAKVVIKKSINNMAAFCDVLSESRLFKPESPIKWVDSNLSLHEKASHNLNSQLTDIQVETLRLLADGLTNAEISRIRFVSEKAVEQIVSRIAQVLNIQPDRSKNLRIQIVTEFFNRIGAPKH